MEAPLTPGEYETMRRAGRLQLTPGVFAGWHKVTGFAKTNPSAIETYPGFLCATSLQQPDPLVTIEEQRESSFALSSRRGRQRYSTADRGDCLVRIVISSSFPRRPLSPAPRRTRRAPAPRLLLPRFSRPLFLSSTSGRSRASSEESRCTMPT